MRVETHCYAGYSVSPYYDPLLAKLIVTANNRADACKKLLAALHEFEIGGIATNIPFLRRIVASPEFLNNQVDTSFVGRFLERSA